MVGMLHSGSWPWIHQTVPSADKEIVQMTVTDGKLRVNIGLLIVNCASCFSPRFFSFPSLGSELGKIEAPYSHFVFGPQDPLELVPY